MHGSIILSQFVIQNLMIIPSHFIDLSGLEEDVEEALASEEKLQDLQGVNNSGTGDMSWAVVGWIMAIIGMISLCCILAFFKRHFGR